MRLCDARALSLLFVLASACAATTRSDLATRGEDAIERPEEHPDDSDLTDAALRASGFESPASLRRARARFEGLASPTIEQLRSVSDPRERARRLLAMLHQKGGMLGEYDARATTLDEILERRRYNCVSASVLYNLLAERLHLAVSAQLLPTHARTIMDAPGSKKRLIIETTSPDGFDPDPRMQATILAQVSGASADGRPLVPDAGSIVPTRVLIGTIYVNRASIAQEGGDLQGAERLFARGEAFAGSRAMRSVLRDQRAALLSQLGANDLLTEDPTRVDRAYRSIEAALRLDPTQPQIRAAALQNLRAAAERKVHARAGARDEKAVLEVVEHASALGLDRSDQSGLRAFAFSELARVRLERNDFEGAVTILDRAVVEQLGRRDARLKQALEENHVSALRLAAIASAKRGELDRSFELIDRIRRLPDLTPAQRGDTANDQLQLIHLVGTKRVDEGDLQGALEAYREGVRRFPRDPACRQNVVAVLERLTLPLVSSGECARVDAYVEEISAIDPKSTFAANARLRCLLERSRSRLEASDYAEAVSLLRAAHEVSPKERAVLGRLASALLEWTRALARAGTCGRAAALARELRTLGVDAVGEGEIQRALGTCRE